KITVLSLPAGGGGGRSADDRGVVGQGLTLDLRIEPAATRVGEPIEAATTVTGVGNVALWPEPVVRWPPGFRAYPAQTEMRLAPPVAAWLLRRRGRAAAPASPDGAGDRAPTRLGRLEHEFLAVLASHVSDAFARDGDGLAQALRAAGIDSAVADHVKRLRDRLRAARYGPRGLGDAAELAAEIEQVLRVLGADGPAGAGARRPRTLVASILVLGIGLVGARHAVPLQSPRAEALYEAGALRA